MENLQNQLFNEVDFHFNVTGVTETKISNANPESGNGNGNRNGNGIRNQISMIEN